MKPDQERVKNLLESSIKKLCKEGLKYKSKFSIQGLLGITLDDEDVFLIDIQEKIEDSHKYVSPLEASVRASIERSSASHGVIRTQRNEYNSNELNSMHVTETVIDKIVPEKGAQSDNRCSSRNYVASESVSSSATVIACTDPLSAENTVYCEGIRPPQDNQALPTLPRDKTQTSCSPVRGSLECALDMSVDVLDAIRTESISALDNNHDNVLNDTKSVLSFINDIQNSADGISLIQVKTEKLDAHEDLPADCYEGNDENTNMANAEDGKSSDTIPLEDTTWDPDVESFAVHSGDFFQEGHNLDSGVGDDKAGAASTLNLVQDQTDPFTCHHCNKHYKTAGSLNKHVLLQHTSRRKFSCTHCGKVFCQKSDLKRHLRTHTEEKPYCCSVCGQYFTDLASITKHQFTHATEKTFKCDICKKCFVSRYELKQHNTMHGDLKFSCNLCDKIFNCKGHLKRHKMFHSGVKPFACDRCEKAFTQFSDLKRHQLTHTQEKPFACKMCGKQFRQQSSATYCQMAHQGTRPHVCHSCGRSFSNLGSLKQHLLSHSTERLYFCDQCGKSFKTPGALRRHKLFHSGEKHYRCEQCGKAFLQSSDLKRHAAIHTGKKAFVCDTCGAGFRSFASLKAHRQEH